MDRTVSTEHAMPVTFFLTYPRSRTAWLATYLTGMGVYCYHELWRTVASINDFKDAMDSKGPGPVANVDACNWFFLEELQATFPDAQYIVIMRDFKDVNASGMKSYGCNFTPLEHAYRTAQQTPPVSMPVVAFDTWDEQTSRQIMRLVAPDLPFNEDWHRRMHQLNVQVTKERIAQDMEFGRTGKINHISEHIRRLVWVQ